MTTERLVLARNMSLDNEVFMLDKEPKCTLSGAAYEWNNWENKIETTERALRLWSSLLMVTFPEYSHWLLIGNRTWQPDNRIVRHRKLWSTLMAKSIPIPTGEKHDEVAVTSVHGIKYFGAIRCDSIVGCALGSTLRSNWETQLIFADRPAAEAACKSLVQDGFDHVNNSPPNKLLDVLCDYNAFGYLPLGWFDDRRSGCAVIARERLIASLFKELLLL